MLSMHKKKLFLNILMFKFLDFQADRTFYPQHFHDKKELLVVSFNYSCLTCIYCQKKVYGEIYCYYYKYMNVLTISMIYYWGWCCFSNFLSNLHNYTCIIVFQTKSLYSYGILLTMFQLSFALEMNSMFLGLI